MCIIHLLTTVVKYFSATIYKWCDTPIVNYFRSLLLFFLWQEKKENRTKWNNDKSLSGRTKWCQEDDEVISLGTVSETSSTLYLESSKNIKLRLLFSIREYVFAFAHPYSLLKLAYALFYMAYSGSYAAKSLIVIYEKKRCIIVEGLHQTFFVTRNFSQKKRHILVPFSNNFLL